MFEELDLSKTQVATLILIGIALTVSISLAVNSIIVTIQNQGQLTTVNITASINSLDWGTIDNSTTVNSPTFQVTNIGNKPVTLTLSTSNLSPSIITLDLTWNYAGATIQPNEQIDIFLTQTLTASGDWNYDTLITGVEA